MGTINYGTSDYITIGLEPYDFDDYLELNEDGSEWTNYEARQDDMELAMECAKHARAKYDFRYFYVKIEPGYYEGFYIRIEHNFGLGYDSSEDKREAQKEITQIKRFLLDCLDYDCVQCFPGWCTGYASKEKTLEGIKEAVKAMREEVRTTPTWWACERQGIEV